MLPFSIFILSGAGIATITISKRLEERRKTGVFLLKAVSRGDERVREIHHKALHHYSYGKDRFAFWFKKQMPLKIKSLWNHFLAYLEEKSVEYLGDVRNSRLLKKSDGISEFFKNISEIEKGGGEINDEVYTIDPMMPGELTAEPIVTMAVEPTAHTTPTHIQKKPRAPRKKKSVRLTVVEEL
jgi:hypothetical protein